MPGRLLTDSPAAPRRKFLVTGPPPTSGPGWKTALAGGAALAAAVAVKNPKLAKTAIGKIGDFLNGVRYTSMLSGFATPQSLLGNVGEVGVQALERGSMKPIQQFFSKRTAKAFGKALYHGETVGPVAGGLESTAGAVGAHRLNPFGRIMGAADKATRGALTRSGLTEKAAEAAVLQKPLEPRYAEALDSSVARTMFPFRRTPTNLFLEGFGNIRKAEGSVKKLLAGAPLLPEELRQLALTAGMGAAGGAHGAATADDSFPVSTALATALANRYGVPYAMGVFLGRHFAGGNDSTSNAISSILPFAEYGVESTLAEPFRSFNPANAAAVRAYKRLVQ